MNPPLKNHRPAVAAVAAAAAGALMTIAAAGAHAIPDDVRVPAVVGSTADATDRHVERPCFITPPTWNEALDGPLPRCRTEIP